MAGSVTRGTVEAWAGWAEQQKQADGRPYAAATLTSVFTLLKTVLRDMAADLGMADPTVRVKPPTSKRRAVRTSTTCTPEQLGQLLEVVKRHRSDWYPEVYVVAFTGMRAGELYALEWADLHPERSAIHIERAVWHGEVGVTKTDAARVVAMPPEMWALLQEHRQRLMRVQHVGLASGLVFPADNGRHRFPSALLKVLVEASELAELPLKVTPQVLRRTFNTLLVELGVPGVVIRAQMGHTTARMTERYAGVHLERKLEATSALLGVVRGK